MIHCFSLLFFIFIYNNSFPTPVCWAYHRIFDSLFIKSFIPWYTQYFTLFFLLLALIENVWILRTTLQLSRKITATRISIIDDPHRIQPVNNKPIINKSSMWKFQHNPSTSLASHVHRGYTFPSSRRNVIENWSEQNLFPRTKNTRKSTREFQPRYPANSRSLLLACNWHVRCQLFTGKARVVRAGWSKRAWKSCKVETRCAASRATVEWYNKRCNGLIIERSASVEVNNSHVTSCNRVLMLRLLNARIIINDKIGGNQLRGWTDRSGGRFQWDEEKKSIRCYLARGVK